MDRHPNRHTNHDPDLARHTGAAHSGIAKWLCIAALVAGAGWNTWNVAITAARGESPVVPFVAAVLMTMVALVAWRRWP